MKTKTPLLAAAATFLILSCTTQRPEPPREPAPLLLGSVTQSSAPRFQQPPHLERFKACQLGTTCMALDPRPFELCLVGTKHCSEKVTEPLLVVDELVVTPADLEQIVKAR
jgi:hypothetical protein